MAINFQQYDAPHHREFWQFLTPTPQTVPLQQSALDLEKLQADRGTMLASILNQGPATIAPSALATPSGNVLSTGPGTTPEIPAVLPTTQIPYENRGANTFEEKRMTTGSQLNNLFSNRNFTNLLAGIGTGLDPEGAGGALGRATIQYNRSAAQQEAVAKAEQQREEWNRQLLRRQGPITPAGAAGASKVTFDSKGAKIEYEAPPELQPGASSPTEGQTNYPTVAGTLKNPTMRTANMSDLFPFS